MIKGITPNIEQIDIRRDEQDLQDGTSHLYPVHPVHPVNLFKQCDFIFDCKKAAQYFFCKCFSRHRFTRIYAYFRLQRC